MRQDSRAPDEASSDQQSTGWASATLLTRHLVGAGAATVADACPPLRGRVLQRGDSGGATVSGTTVGGNLTSFATLVGSEAWPQLDGAILVLEDVHEEPYRLDRM
jgi:muramoyltetrapeptide carboxypeptidase